MSEIKKILTLFESLLCEAKGHLDHPEDLVFINGIDGANHAISMLTNTVNNPNQITIKFDGYPALIFGRGQDNNFAIMDKHMFNRKDGSGRQIYSPKEFIEYDRARGVDRGDLYSIIETIWPGLEKEDRGASGYYWGDLLFRSPLKDENGVFRFRANPSGIAYSVETNSELGRLLADKVAGIAVHQYIPMTATSTDQAVSLNGSIGNLQNNSNVAIVPSKMPFVPKLKLPKKLINIATKEIQQNTDSISALLNNSPQASSAFSQLFTVYLNKKIVSGNLSNLLRDFMDYVKDRQMSDAMKAKIISHLEENKNGVSGIFKVWIALYNLKTNIIKQLDEAAKHSPVKGQLQDGSETHEGYVFQDIKLVDRLGFSKQNLAKN